jgi:hypothetical protein
VEHTRSAKILLKMNKEEVKAQLPEWFDGEVYEVGDEVSNPFSGETCFLDAAELSMYDLVKGLEMALLIGMQSDDYIETIRKGQDWFLAKNPKAYMKLLD